MIEVTVTKVIEQEHRNLAKKQKHSYQSAPLKMECACLLQPCKLEAKDMDIVQSENNAIVMYVNVDRAVFASKLESFTLSHCLSSLDSMEHGSYSKKALNVAESKSEPTMDIPALISSILPTAPPLRTVD